MIHPGTKLSCRPFESVRVHYSVVLRVTNMLSGAQDSSMRARPCRNGCRPHPCPQTRTPTALTTSLQTLRSMHATSPHPQVYRTQSLVLSHGPAFSMLGHLRPQPASLHDRAPRAGLGPFHSHSRLNRRSRAARRILSPTLQSGRTPLCPPPSRRLEYRSRGHEQEACLATSSHH